jgi:hypothetical protein
MDGNDPSGMDGSDMGGMGGGLDQSDISGWGMDNGGAFAGAEGFDGMGGMDTSMFESFDVGGYGMGQMSNGLSASYSDAAMPGYAAEEDNSFFGKLSRMAQQVAQNPLGKMAIGRVSQPLGMVNSMAQMANKAGNSPTRGGALGTIGGFTGGVLGGAFGGPVGGLAGQQAGQALGNAIGGNSPSYSGPTGQQNANEMGSGNMSLGTGIGMGLAGLYGNHMANKDMKGLQGNLQNMYGQKSPYAQALRQQLARRDAAGGRRSQYGPREVELQAALAGQYSRNAGTLAQMGQQRGQNRNQMLGQLAGLYGHMGGYQGIKGGLQDFFGPGLMGKYTDGMDVPSLSGQDYGGSSLFGGQSNTPSFDDSFFDFGE